MKFLRLSLQALRGISTVCAGVSLSLSSLAQSAPADTGSVTTTGQITTTTCAVNSFDFGTNNFNRTGLATFALGTFSPAAVTGTAGTIFGSKVGVTYNLLSSTSQTPAACASFNTGWDLSIQVAPEQIVTIDNATTTALGTKTFIKNALPGGTNAVVALFGGNSNKTANNISGADANLPLTLVGNAGDSANYLSGGSSIRNVSDQRLLAAQFVKSTDAAPTAGQFSQTLTLLAVYR
jgi:hypothetical protein